MNPSKIAKTIVAILLATFGIVMALEFTSQMVFDFRLMHNLLPQRAWGDIFNRGIFAFTILIPIYVMIDIGLSRQVRWYGILGLLGAILSIALIYMDVLETYG
jgi:hypothetical protein